MQRLIRLAMPWILLGLGFAIWFEKYVPGHERFREVFGRDGLMRFAIGFLCLQMVLLILDRMRLERAFKELVQAFRDFHRTRGEQAEGAEPDPQQQRQALVILVEALGSPDAAVRSTALDHLQRITGQSLGEDRGEWIAWIDRNLPRVP